MSVAVIGRLAITTTQGLKALVPNSEEPKRSKTSRPDVPDTSSSAFEVEAEMYSLKQSLADVTGPLRQERSQRVQHEFQIRQDMLLEKLQAEKKGQREIEKLERNLRLASKAIDVRVCRGFSACQYPCFSAQGPSAAC